ENGTKKKREWVKNAIIIFLVIMLLLTFFSNTIMNYSLPEVSAQYCGGGTLSEQIRGTAKVEAAESFSVKIDQSRVIASVEVKSGDTVEKGQTIFKLEDGDSAELEAAKTELEALELEYKKMLLNTGADYSLDELAIRNLEEDIARAKSELDNIAVYEDNYEKAKRASEAAQDKVDSLKAEQSVYTDALTAITSEDYASLDPKYYNMIKSAQDALAQKEQIKTDADKKVEDIKAELGGGVDNTTLTAKKAEIDKAEINIQQLTIKYNNAIVADEGVEEAKQELENARIDIEQMRNEYAELSRKYNEASSADSRLTYAEVAQSNAEKNYNTAKEKLSTTITDITREIKAAQKSYDDKISAAERELKDAQEAEAEAKEKASVSVDAAKDDILAKERELETKRITLAQQQKKDLDAAGESALDVQAKLDEIERKEEQIKKLEEKTIGAEIQAQVGGIIDNISCVAGETVEAGFTLANIQMTEKGYSASITVTNDQAKKVKVGDEAEIQYFWSGDARAVLTSIKAEQSNAQNKVLTFSVTGDVTPGQSLQLVMGSKGQQYDMIIPNSSIREDSNGKFVLRVVSRSSPLGNRYIAERVNITVIASDDKSSAVSGELLQSDFIISTATKPVEAGQQVRLVESN
ncbi:MAG: HlyD family efflux transporter periplasmic adaptor subunit, partial [Oscillospiraceae bacterium]